LKTSLARADRYRGSLELKPWNEGPLLEPLRALHLRGDGDSIARAGAFDLAARSGPGSSGMRRGRIAFFAANGRLRDRVTRFFLQAVFQGCFACDDGRKIKLLVRMGLPEARLGA
jgi:hypothetical protein